MATTSSDTPALEAIERAADRVIANFPGGSRADDVELVRVEVEGLVEAFEGALFGEAPPAPIDSGELDRLRMLRMLRTEFLRQWSDENGSLLAAMQAFERVQASLVEWMENASIGEVLSPFSRSLLREVAHLLRSPLGSIVMMADMMRESGAGVSDAQRRQLDIIHRSALSIATSAGDLLTLVGDEDRFGVVERFSVGETLETVRNVVGPVAEARGRELRVERSVDLHRSGPEYALLEVLLGLALRATLRAKGGTVVLSGSATDSDVVRFSVVSRAGEPEPEGDDLSSLLHVFRVDPESRSYTLSDAGLTVAAARRTLGTLGTELRVEKPDAAELRLEFDLSLPNADGG
jgi:signal transduction histidine kinase